MSAKQRPPTAVGGSGSRRVGAAAQDLNAAVALHRQGRLGEAERIYRRVLERHPAQADALNLLGVAAGQRNDAGAAVGYFERAVRASSRNPIFYYNLGMAQHRGGHLEAAETSYRRALALKSDYADALKGLGGVLFALSKLDEAETCCRKVVRLARRDPRAHHNLSTVLLVRGAADEAADCAREALRLKPDYAEAHNNLGAAHLAGEAYDEGAVALREALRLAPSYPEAHNNLGMALLGTGELNEAIASFRAAIEARPEYVEAHSNLGKTFRHMGYKAEAEQAYREALRHNPEFPGALVGLAAVNMDWGDVNASLALYNELLEHRPDAPSALAGKATILDLMGDVEGSYAIIAPLVDASQATPGIASVFGRIAGRFGQRDKAIALLEDLLAGPEPTKEEQRVMHFALGKLYDGVDAFDEALHHFAAGNALLPTPFNPQRFSNKIDRIIAYSSKENLAKLPRASNDSELPVFVVGTPRSGTSLTEQILASHPQVHGAGELDDIPGIVRSLAGGPGKEDTYPECTADLDQDAIVTFAERHLAMLHERAGGAVRVTDKMPYNFLHLGLISQLFPKARVIHCVRDPLDTCLSCFFQLFLRGNFQTYRLEHLGAYHTHYQRLMQHWREVLDLQIIDLRYEDLVADLETHSRQMVDFVGLDWDLQCLRFHESERVVYTASYDQVRQPIYSRSVGRWRHYEKHLAPLIEALGRDADATG